jgi:DNA replication and repair protein RecF
VITSLRLQKFRSYSDESFEFESGVNIVVGPNASGKTNLLEAVLVLCRGSSYRAKDVELIKFNKPWARLDGAFVNQTRVVKLENEPNFNKTYELDDKLYKRLRLEQTVPIVFFEPNHLQLISRGPDQRRDYFDELLERSQPTFKSLSASYKRALAQRNALLKQDPARAHQQLFAWNIRLSELGSKIAASRQELINDINKVIAKTYSQIAHQKSKVSLEYATQFPIDNYASKMLSKLEASTSLDFMRGFTAYGPHREDIVFYLGGELALSSASRGETRSLLLALKIFELNLIEQARQTKPIFLLDDVFSELDGARRRALVDHLKDQQTIITTTDAEAVLEYFSKDAQNILALSK